LPPEGAKSPTVVNHLLEIVERRAPAQRGWLRHVAATADPPLLEHAFVDATRRVGAAPLALGDEERAMLANAGLGWSLAAWAVDDAARAAWAALACGHGGESLVERRWRHGDARQRIAILRALPLLPEPSGWLALAIQARQGAMRAVFEALACDNPYPATHFHDVHFEDMVLSALDADLPLQRIVGLRGRLSARLSDGAARLAERRRASGRSVPDDIQRLAHDWRSAA
jgi:hypothetical protein